MAIEFPASERREAVRSAVRSELKRLVRPLSDYVPGKAYVSDLTNDELKDVASKLSLDVPAIIAKAENEFALRPKPLAGAQEAFSEAMQALSASVSEPAPVDATQRAEQALAPLAPVQGMLAPQIWQGLVSGVSALVIETERLKQEMAQLRAENENNAALRSVAPAQDGEEAKPAAFVTAAQAFGLTRNKRLQRINMELWNAPDAPRPDPHFVFEPETLEDCCNAIRRGRKTWLYGPAGTGKTSLATQLAARLGRPFVRIAFNRHTEPVELWGGRYPDGNGGTCWHDGALTAAIRNPGTVVLLDEPTICRPGTLAAVQTLLDENYVTLETGERVDVAQGVVFFAADNTNGTGDASGNYADTQAMNLAFRDRFSKSLHVDYLSAELETQALVNRTGLVEEAAKRLVGFARKTREKCSTGDITAGVGFRRLLALAEALLDGQSAQRAIDTCLLNGAPAEDLAALAILTQAELNQKELEALARGETLATPDQPKSYAKRENERAANDFSDLT